ncbi:hypothetical protein GJ496_002026 [Pomphorhynchus laevis]|nr:hypothetical protein GJ496_002026 [Pomphorhynchus laevis]
MVDDPSELAIAILHVKFAMIPNNSMIYPNGCGGTIFRQLVYTQEPPVEYVINRRRLPTPPPDILEKIVVVRPQEL